MQLTRNGGFDAEEAPDGKFLYYTRPQGGLWSMPVEGGKGTLVLDDAASPPDGVTPLMWLSFATHELVQVGAVSKPITTASPTLSVTSDGRCVAWAQIDRQESELMPIENFR